MITNKKGSQRGITAPEKLLKIANFLKKYLDIENNYSILDVGGTKHTYKFWKRIFPESKIFALNNCQDDIKGFENSILGDAEKLSKYVNEESIDIVIATDIIEHLIDPDAFLDGCEYVLKKGGVLIMTTPNLATIYNRFVLLFGYSPFNYSPSIRHRVGVPFTSLKIPADHKSVFTFKALRELLRLHNFEIVHSDGYTYAGKIYEGSGGSERIKLRLLIDKLLPVGLKEGLLIVSKISKRRIIEDTPLIEGYIDEV